jgi:hypothetical protein
LTVVKCRAVNINSDWEFGAQATTAVKARDKGAANQGTVAVAPGSVSISSLNNGLAPELTAKRTKYYKNGDLNSDARLANWTHLVKVRRQRPGISIWTLSDAQRHTELAQGLASGTA